MYRTVTSFAARSAITATAELFVVIMSNTAKHRDEQ